MTKKLLTICGLGCLLLSNHAVLNATVSQAMGPALQPTLAWFGWFKRDKKEDAAGAEQAAADAASAEQTGGLKAAEIRKMAEDALKLIQSKRGEFEQVAAALKQIPLPEQMGATAREYQKQAAGLTSQINELRQQAEGYIAQLKAMGVPVDSLVESLNQMLTAEGATEK